MKKSKIDKTIEYEQMVAYVFHMFDTRHKAFNFMIVLNLALVTAYGNLSLTDSIEYIFPILGLIINIALIAFAYRSNKALGVIESIAREIEKEAGFSSLNKIEKRLKNPIRSTFYLFIIYWVFIIFWIGIFIYSLK